MYFKQFLVVMIFCAVALHATAQISFTKTYPTLESSRGADVVKANDGGYLIAGDTLLNSTDPDIYLIKTDSLGELQWTKTLGVLGKGEEVRSVIKTSNNGYAVVGSVEWQKDVKSYPFIYKLDSLGNTQWYRDSISNFGNAANDVVETSDGGYLLGGGGASYTAGILKMDSLGNTEWQQSLGFLYGDAVTRVIATFDKGYLIAAGAYVPNSRGRLIKLDNLYSIEWDKNYYTSGVTGFWDVIQIQDSSFIVLGSQFMDANLYDVLVVKTSQEGDSLWFKTFSGGVKQSGGAYQDAGYAIIEDKDSTLSVLCELQGNVGILNLTAEGDSINYQPICKCIAGYMIREGNSLVITGDFWDYASSTNGLWYPFLLKTDSFGNFEDLINGIGNEQLKMENGELVIYPNPAREDFFVRTILSEPSILKAYDLMGRVVYTSQTISVNEPFTKIDVRDWNNGLYIVEIGEHRAKVMVNH